MQQGIAIAVQQGWVSTGLQQELDHLGLLGDDCQMQWCLQDSSTSSAALTRGAKSCTTIISSSYNLFRSVTSPQQEQLQEPPGLENTDEELLPGRAELAALKNMYLLQVIGDVDDLLAGDANNYVDQLLDHSCLFMDNSQVQRPVERWMAPSSAPRFSRYSCCPQSPHNGSDKQDPTLSLQTPHVLTCLRSHPVTRPGASGLPAACGGRRSLSSQAGHGHCDGLAPASTAGTAGLGGKAGCHLQEQQPHPPFCIHQVWRAAQNPKRSPVHASSSERCVPALPQAEPLLPCFCSSLQYVLSSTGACLSLPGPSASEPFICTPPW